LSYKRTVVVIQWGGLKLGPDDTNAQKDFSAGNIKSTFLYILKEDEMTNFV
jgi:hypothetical protein